MEITKPRATGSNRPAVPCSGRRPTARTGKGGPDERAPGGRSGVDIGLRKRHSGSLVDFGRGIRHRSEGPTGEVAQWRGALALA